MAVVEECSEAILKDWVEMVIAFHFPQFDLNISETINYDVLMNVEIERKF